MFAHTFHETLLRVEGLRVEVGGTSVLSGVDAEIKDVVRPDVIQGQVVSVLGPSGVGKSTLIRVLAGLQPPTEGRVLLTERQCPVRAGMVGVVHQSCPLFEHQTVLENLLMASRDIVKARQLLARFGLREREDAWPAELSGGERQRVAILQQLMCGHTYLLMDEPFSCLDPVNKGKVCELIADLTHLDTRTTIIVVTHDIREAIKIADTLWLLGREPGRDGSRIVATYNLIERDLAWSPGIEHTPAFAALARELENRFATL